PSPRSIRDWLERCHDEAAVSYRLKLYPFFSGRGKACVQVLHRGSNLVTGGGKPDPGQENGGQKSIF
ncbi:MAG: hypothetical protein OXH47_10015, partial [Paracoccaceae bacterium]|nr:hypothetical protein [Paracoccaceae bacterium]